MSAIELIAGEPKPRETNKAKLACNDYLRMGAGRSLAKLLQTYSESKAESPTINIQTLNHWSKTYEWQARAAEYDQRIEERKTAEANEVLTTGLALSSERIKGIRKIVEKLELDLSEGLYQKDIKLAANGTTVDVEVFKAQQIAAYGRLLDDIAKEVGDRKQKTDVNASGKITIEIEHVNDWRNPDA